MVVGTANACPGAANTYDFSIGKDVSYFPTPPYDNAFFPGNIDEVAAFNHALSPSAIQQIYQSSQYYKIGITPQGAGYQVSWPVGRLLSAPTLKGPWTTNTGAVSPLNVSPGSAQEYYRGINP